MREREIDRDRRRDERASEIEVEQVEGTSDDRGILIPRVRARVRGRSSIPARAHACHVGAEVVSRLVDQSSEDYYGNIPARVVDASIGRPRGVVSRVVDWILLLVRGRGMQMLGLLGYNGTRKTTPNQGNEMAKAIEITDLQLTGEDKKGRPVFTATGTLEERSFTARTIIHKGEPIFKLQEAEGHQGLEGSAFNRGDRIAVARACKALRLELFGTGQKAKVEGELETGETVELVADDEPLDPRDGEGLQATA